MAFNPPREEKNIEPFFKMAATGRMIDISKKFDKVKMLGRILNISHRNKSAEKLSKKARGVFLVFPRFGNAHCTYFGFIIST